MTPTRCPLPRHHSTGDYFNARLFYARTAAGADIEGAQLLWGHLNGAELDDSYWAADPATEVHGTKMHRDR